MARHKRNANIEGRFLAKRKAYWASELCAEHDGSIATFRNLNVQLNELAEYRQLFLRERPNLLRTAKIAGGMVAGALVFCPAAYFAAPGIASALGASGLLGAASTGTAISTLHGAALTSASLAAIGPGGMAGGVIFISAAGAALGAKEGGVVSNNYFGAIKDFGIQKVRSGKGPALVFVNGFLSQKRIDASDWLAAVSSRFPNNPCYLVTWEASTLFHFGSRIAKASTKNLLKQAIPRLVNRSARTISQKANPLSWASMVKELFDNPWHRAMAKASMTGVVLADLLARTQHDHGFLLFGHSLGARVIYYTLEALSTTGHSPVRGAYLLGGAVGRNDQTAWVSALGGVSGKIHNYFSENDWALKYLYQGANALLSRPIGIGPIALNDPRIVNHDVSESVMDHMKYKEIVRDFP